MMSSANSYPGIDLEETGKHIKRLIGQRGYSVKDIQRLLHLSCPQPIYRWLKGQMLPTVDHLYSLARILHVHMEELLVPQDKTAEKVLAGESAALCRRMAAYRKSLLKMAA